MLPAHRHIQTHVYRISILRARVLLFCVVWIIYVRRFHLSTCHQLPRPPRYTFMVRTYVGAHMPLNIKSAFSLFHSANPSPPPPQDNPDPNDCTRDRGDGIYVYGASSENLWRAPRRVFNTRAMVYSGCMRCPVIFLFFFISDYSIKNRFFTLSPRWLYIYISHHHDPVVVHIASGSWCSVKYAPQTKYNIILWRSAGPI